MAANTTPYFTIDLITSEGKRWLSEIEIDGAVGFNGDPEQDRIAATIVTARFRAYIDGHAAHLANGKKHI